MRILGPDGTYSCLRPGRNSHGFSAQDHLMRLAAGTGDAQRNAILSGSAVVYTPRDATAGAADGEGETTGQESSNAAV